MKPFDDKLADNIRKVFDEYQEPVDEKAWLAMQQRLGKKSGPRVIALFPRKVWAAAAIILLMVVSATVWFTLRPIDEEVKMAVTAPETRDTAPAGDSALHDADLPAEDAATHLHDTQPAQTPAPGGKDIFLSEHKVSDERKTIPPTAPLIAHTEEETPEEKPVWIAEADIDVPEPQTKPAEDFPADPEKPVQEKIAVNGLSPDIRYPGDIIPVQRSRGSAMQFMAGPMVTYTTGEIAEGLGFSAGVTGDFRILDDLSINTGGILVYNQFRFDDNSMFGVAMDALPNYNVADGLTVIEESGYVDYEFMALDIPLNVRLNISNDSRSQFYVSAGLSSFVYLQQSFSRNAEILADITSEDYMGNTSTQRNFSSITTSGSVDAFRRFDLARFLNLSAGYVVKRENYNMIIEPYLKYPMYDVTSFDLKIGMAGLSLKYQLGGR
jgi:hypothetical protein